MKPPMAFIPALSGALPARAACRRGLHCGGRPTVPLPLLCSRSRSPLTSPTMVTTTEAAWTSFADKMRADDAIPPLASWNELLSTAATSGELDKALWILGTMKATGTRPTAVTYEILLAGCAAAGDRQVAFSLIEQMWDDKVLLGDVTLPDGMEDTLRAILPPEAFD